MLSALLVRLARFFHMEMLDGATGDEKPDFTKGFANHGVKTHRAVVDLTAGTSTAGGATFSWQNPHAGTILITRVTLYVSTQSTGAATVDIGTTAVSATTTSDTLLDGKTVAAAGVFDNVLAANLGTNGKPSNTLATGKWITGTPSATTAGMVGKVYIDYTEV